ncbi:DUF7344 domain-containing protein [Halobaculum marinum]|uniref:ArsR family transcriptional regulator n=1 Tax=Halobaculum marinum TaxID=3031996 RepID=A0ABD5WZY9_9EURY|nr:hypothetical protein [Halobaculum sp. DT55]
MSPTDPSPETYDRWFELLSDGIRRRLLLELSSRFPPPVSVSVPDDIARPDEDPDSLHLRLSHVHLPKLAEAQVVDWNREEGVVSTGPAFESIFPLIQAIEAHDEFEMERG